jgi:hypothetical protein
MEWNWWIWAGEGRRARAQDLETEHGGKEGSVGDCVGIRPSRGVIPAAADGRIGHQLKHEAGPILFARAGMSQYHTFGESGLFLTVYF